MSLHSPEEVGLSSAALARLDDRLRAEYVAPGKLAGVLTAVMRRGKLVHLSPLGQMDRERQRPMRADTIFRIYSMTKPITSVALMTLYERGVFQLYDPVHEWIPELGSLPVYRSGTAPHFVTEPAQRAMTVHDLLTHQAGLTYGINQRSALDAAYRQLRIGSERTTLREMVATLATLPLEFSPGTRWGYSVATDVLGHLIERMSGQALDVFLEEQVLAPLGMLDTSFSVPAPKLERFAASYTVAADGALRLADDPQASVYGRCPRRHLAGGAGLVSTASDYLRFCEMLRRGGSLDGVRILGPRTVALMAQNHLTGGRDLASAAVAVPADTRAEGVGFGLGLAVMLDPARAQASSVPGELCWGGLASTLFWVAPREEMSVVFMTQLVPNSTYDLRGLLRAMLYGAIDD